MRSQTAESMCPTGNGSPPRRKKSVQSDVTPVEAIRERVWANLATVRDFSEAVGYAERTIYEWIQAGMPAMYMRRTAYVRIDEAVAWMRRPSTAQGAPRKPGRPRKIAST